MMVTASTNQSSYLQSGYINASDIIPPRLPGLSRSYIACQAPTKDSKDDMWQMIWEQHCELIVFLTPYYENSRGTCTQKSEPYWPLYRERNDPTTAFLSPAVTRTKQNNIVQYKEPEHGATAIYGNIIVKVEKIDKIENEIIIRHLAIYKFIQSQTPGEKPTCNKRVVRICHYLAWPDHGLPKLESFFNTLSVYRVLRKSVRFEQSPVVVHCSAGIGRTGTFIAVDMMLDYIAEMQRVGQSPDTRKVADIMAHMRSCRSGMVKTAHQYAFIYHFLQYAYGNPLRHRVGLQ